MDLMKVRLAETAEFIKLNAPYTKQARIYLDSEGAIAGKEEGDDDGNDDGNDDISQKKQDTTHHSDGDDSDGIGDDSDGDHHRAK